MTRDFDNLLGPFRDDGYVVLPGFLSQDDAARVREQVTRYIRDVLPGMPREEVFFENRDEPSTLKQIQRMYQYDAYFHDLLIGSRFEALASRLLEAPVRGVNLQYFNKPPGVGKPTPPHQDGFYFMLQPCEAVTLWLALDQADAENGCVRYVRGSHRGGLRSHQRSGTLGFSQGLQDFGTAADLAAEVVLPVRPGDLLAHHALTVHRADGNQSADRSRRALGLIYFSARAVERPEKAARHAALMEELKRTGQV